MSSNFQFKSFWNFVKRNKLYTIINIVGFAVSLMFVILLGIYIQKEFNIDTFHAEKDRIYRLEYTGSARFSGVIPRLLEARYPEIEKTVRVTEMYDLSVEITGEENVRHTGWTFMTDSTFFQIFSFPLIDGDPNNVLRTKYEVVLSESYARQLFGNQSAMGKTIRLQDRPEEYMVTGIARDLEDTHFKSPSMFLSIEVQNDWWNRTAENINQNFLGIYIMTYPGADLAAKIPDMERYFVDELKYPLFAEHGTEGLNINPLENVYFTPAAEMYYVKSNSMGYLTVLMVTALVILVFAVINYINLSVAQTGFRAQEAAMRRLLGGTKRELFGGFIRESVLICLISFLLGLGLAALFQPFFQQMIGTDVTVAEAITLENILFSLGGVVVLGVLSGLVPGVVIAGFKPIEVVRGTFKRKTKMVYSKVLIAFQYCITIVLIGCTVTIIWQVRYMQTAPMGFESDNILFFNNPCRSGEEIPAFKDQLLAVPGVEQVAFADGGPTVWARDLSFLDKDGVNHKLYYYSADSVFVSMMGFEIIHRTGTNFFSGLWVNETAWRRWGMQQGDTEYLNSDEQRFPIAGVIKDFHGGTLQDEIGEIAILPVSSDRRWPLGNVYVKISSANPFAVRDQLGEVYSQKAHGKTLDATFMNDWIEAIYVQQKRMVSILVTLSLLAILISALGMLAMSTYFMRQRSQEVAVRKVFGAMNGQVLQMLMLSFLKLVLLAFVIATPVIWYLMRDWLNGYSYRIGLGWEIFAIAGLVAFAIASITVFWQSLKAAHTNPIVSIKD